MKTEFNPRAKYKSSLWKRERDKEMESLLAELSIFNEESKGIKKMKSRRLLKVKRNYII